MRFAGFGYLRSALWNSVLVGVVTGMVGVFLGYAQPSPWPGRNIRFKKFLHLLFILPIISPPFTSALSVLMLLGANGLITRKLLGIPDYNIYGFKGVMLSQVFTFAPVAYLTLKGVLDSLNPTLEDAAMNVGAGRWQTFRKVTFPLSLPGIASAFLVVFIESLADFGNPLVLAGSRFPMLSTQAYLEITGSFNLPLGAALAVVLMLPSVTAFAIQRYYLQKRQYTTVTGKPTSSSSKLVSKNARTGPDGLRPGLRDIHPSVLRDHLRGGVHQGVGLQLWFDAAAFHLRLQRRDGHHQGYARGGPGIDSPVGPDGHAHRLPGRAFPVSRQGGHGVHVHFELRCPRHGGRYRLHPGIQPAPAVLIGTLAILVLNFVFRYVPVGIQSGIAVLRQIDPSIEEAAQNLGADGITTFRKVTLPLIAPAFFSGLVFAFVRAMTAISAAIFLVSAQWNLLTVQILNQVGSGRLGVAAAFSVILIVIVLVAIAIIGRIVPGREGAMRTVTISEGF